MSFLRHAPAGKVMIILFIRFPYRTKPHNCDCNTNNKYCIHINHFVLFSNGISAGGVRKKTELMRTLPTVLKTENRTIPIEDFPEFLGVCCFPCSCSESCHENDNCCPTIHDMNNHSLHSKVRSGKSQSWSNLIRQFVLRTAIATNYAGLMFKFALLDQNILLLLDLTKKYHVEREFPDRVSHVTRSVECIT